MKKILLFLLAGLLFAPVFAQDDELPSKVNEAFKTKYPKAKSVYGFADNNNYKIEFEIAHDTYTAIYSENGNWIETSKVISDDEVPAKAVSALNKKYQGIEISYAELVESAKDGKFYRVNCYTDEADYIINVTTEGTVLNTEKKSNTYDFEG
jgi:hypothetical protein